MNLLRKAKVIPIPLEELVFEASEKLPGHEILSRSLELSP
jgi:hypothetical protein